MSLHILWGEPHEEVLRERVGVRWCFSCRKRQEFLHIVEQPVDKTSWYGDSHAIRCSTCNMVDSDLFPGRERSWEE